MNKDATIPFRIQQIFIGHDIVLEFYTSKGGKFGDGVKNTGGSFFKPAQKPGTFAGRLLERNRAFARIRLYDDIAIRVRWVIHAPVQVIDFILLILSQIS
jgi:hypothetical protein